MPVANPLGGPGGRDLRTVVGDFGAGALATADRGASFAALLTGAEASLAALLAAGAPEGDLKKLRMSIGPCSRRKFATAVDKCEDTAVYPLDSI